MERSKRFSTAAIIFLAVFHEIGLVGLHLEATKSVFQMLIPLNLLLSIGVLAFFHREWTSKFGIFAFVVFWAGYLVELLGVQTGVIFGEYAYGSALGIKIAGVPPMIGVNWLLLTYITAITAQKLSSNLWMRATLGAAFMVILDFLIEPMAIRYDMWTWAGDSIPAQNFFAWFVIAWGMQYGFHNLHQEKSNPVATPLYLIQLVFFLSFLIIDG
ncbi:MAG: carotenoid biosynthesis protein [Bacteroidota bacterium]